MEYILNGTIVGGGNSLQINGAGITGYDLDDGFAFNIPEGGGGDIALPDGEILVGNGVGVAAPVAMSGDATMNGTGVVTLNGSSQNFPVQGNVRATDGFLSVGGSMTAGVYNVPGGLPQELTGAGAISNSIFQTRWTSTGGAQALSLGVGQYVGQLKKVSYVAEGGFAESGIITPSPASGFSTVTLNDLGGYVVFIWNGTGWTIMEYTGATVA